MKRGSKKGVTFLKKSNQKTFGFETTPVKTSVAQMTKSFLLLFFKKEVLS